MSALYVLRRVGGLSCFLEVSGIMMGLILLELLELLIAFEGDSLGTNRIRI